jgi:hypothetical protein
MDDMFSIGLSLHIIIYDHRRGQTAGAYTTGYLDTKFIILCDLSGFKRVLLFQFIQDGLCSFYITGGTGADDAGMFTL